MTLPSVIQIDEFESSPFFELLQKGPGTYRQLGEIRGNSILSSVFIESIDPGATLQVNYFDTTTGATVGERYDLTAHDPIPGTTPPLTTFRILVPRIHRRVACEVVITGGQVRFSVYCTVVSAFATDLDKALIREGDTFVQTDNRAMPAGVLDDSDGKLYFLRGKAGVLTIEQDFGVPAPLRTSPSLVTTPGSTVDIITSTVPVGKTWRLRSLVGACRAHGYYEVWVGSTRVSRLNSGPATENPRFPFDPYDQAIAGDQVKVKYTQSHGPAVDLSAVLFVTESDA